MKPDLSPLLNLSAVNLKVLAVSLRSGALATGITKAGLTQLLGLDHDDTFTCLSDLASIGMSPLHCATLIEVLYAERGRAPDPARLFELVLSGPDVAGVPTTDTAAVVDALFREATAEVLLFGYAIFNGEIIFDTLATMMRLKRDLRVRFCLDIPRRYGDCSHSEKIIRRFVDEFRQKHWPWPELPELYYDPRALAETFDQRASLHAKAVLVDRKSGLVTSANFTDAAQKKNIEIGVLIRHTPMVERLVQYADGLINASILLPCYLK